MFLCFFVPRRRRFFAALLLAPRMAALVIIPIRSAPFIVMNVLARQEGVEPSPQVLETFGHPVHWRMFTLHGYQLRSTMQGHSLDARIRRPVRSRPLECSQPSQRIYAANIQGEHVAGQAGEEEPACVSRTHVRVTGGRDEPHCDGTSRRSLSESCGTPQHLRPRTSSHGGTRRELEGSLGSGHLHGLCGLPGWRTCHRVTFCPLNQLKRLGKRNCPYAVQSPYVFSSPLVAVPTSLRFSRTLAQLPTPFTSSSDISNVFTYLHLKAEAP